MADLVKKADEALEQRPSWIPEGDTTGTTVDPNEVRLPRLAIAQGLSPQMTPGTPQYLDGLKLFDLFNDLSGQIYGRGPLTFVPVRHDVRRIEFKSRADGGGVLDPNVPADDPRMFWSEDAEGKSVRPRATRFDEWVVLLLHADGSREPIVLSVSHTNKDNRNAARNLQTFIGLPHSRFGLLPIYGKKYTIESAMAKNDSGTFGVPVIKPAGVLTDADAGMMAMTWCRSLEGKTVNVDRGRGDEDAPATDDGDVPF